MEPFIFGNVLEKSKPTASNDLKVSRFSKYSMCGVA